MVKYMGYIVKNSLTDDDDIARKICLYASANVLARKCVFVVPPPKLLYFKLTVVQSALLIFGAN